MTDSNTPNIKVLFFGYLTERCGTAELLETALSTDELKDKLEARFTPLKGLNYLMAVNQNQVQGNEALHEGDEVALMPPFAGG